MIFVHVPKCAGTTIITALRQVYKDRLYHDTDFRRIKTRHIAWQWQNQLPFGRHKEPVPIPCFKCIVGHFTHEKYSYLKLPMFVFLREPLPRVISQFSIGITRERTTFEKFVVDGANNVSRMVGPLSQYFFVGLLEHFEESMRMLEWFGNISFTWPLAYRNHHKREKYRISDDQKALFLSTNQKDIDLYAQACDRFYQQREIYNGNKQADSPQEGKV